MAEINNILNKEKSNKGFASALKKVKKLSTRTKVILGIILVLILIGGYFLLKPKKQIYEWTTVQRGDIIQEVSANGTVEGTNEIDLKFKTAGTIDKILVKVGDKVKKGAALVRLDTGEVYSQYLQAQASYNQSKAKLDQFVAGSTREEIKVAQQVVENAQTSLGDAKTKANNDLNQKYNTALSYLISSSSKCNKALTDMRDVASAYFYDSTELSRTFADKKAFAEESYWGSVSGLMGAQEMVENALNDPTEENIDKAIINLWTALQKTINLLDYAKTAVSDPTLTGVVSSADKTMINTDAGEIAAAFTNIGTVQTDISNQRITNQININSSDSALKKAQLDLLQLQAPARDVDIAVYQADVQRYKASLDEYNQKLTDASIIAPFDGEIAKIDAKIGEVLSANAKTIITLLSPNGFEIKADIPETDIGDVAMNNPVSIVLDAFPEEIFTGEILEMNPAETVIEGVAYYQVKVLFIDPIIKLRSGMSGDVTIQTNKKDNVLYVPQSAVITRNGDKLARILSEDNKITEVKITSGLRGSSGEIEIIGGLSEGEKVITYLKTP